MENLIGILTWFKSAASCIILIQKHALIKSGAFTTALSDFNLLTSTFLISCLIKREKTFYCPDYKNINIAGFRDDSQKSRIGFLTVKNFHASLGKKSLRSNNSSFMINTLQSKIMKKSLLKKISFKNKSIAKIKK